MELRSQRQVNFNSYVAFDADRKPAKAKCHAGAVI